jgi:hypothetical protein
MLHPERNVRKRTGMRRNPGLLSELQKKPPGVCAMADRRPEYSTRNRWSMPVAALAVVAAIALLFIALSDRTSTERGGNVTQTTNPTNAPGTSKQP